MSDIRRAPIARESFADGYQADCVGLPPAVLVVDDNRDAAHALTRLLCLLGIDATEAHSGSAALAALERQKPSIVFLDLDMSEMDGFETARQIRRRPSGQEIALIALTGLGHEEVRERTRDAGFAAHLVKPVDLELLERTLDFFLGHLPGRSSGKSREGGPENRLP